jgi:hypothetical protein
MQRCLQPPGRSAIASAAAMANYATGPSRVFHPSSQHTFSRPTTCTGSDKPTSHHNHEPARPQRSTNIRCSQRWGAAPNQLEPPEAPPRHCTPVTPRAAGQRHHRAVLTAGATRPQQLSWPGRDAPGLRCLTPLPPFRCAAGNSRSGARLRSSQEHRELEAPPLRRTGFARRHLWQRRGEKGERGRSSVRRRLGAAAQERALS